MAQTEELKCITRDLVQCPLCKTLMWVYVFNNGEMRSIHKHNGEVKIPSPYVPLQANFKKPAESPDVPDSEDLE